MTRIFSHPLPDDVPGPLPASMLLLIVDDQPANIDILYALFKDEFTVCIATNGRDALQFCQDRKPDLVLLDVVMPGMGGHEVCQRLKEDPLTRGIPVIFVTGQTDPMDETHGLDVGGVDFISKPFHASVVRARVRTHLLLKHQSDQLRAMALVDGLTGVANRRHFEASLQAEWRRCARTEQPLSLIMADVDFFKRFNDHYGHQAGDLCLRAIAGVLKAGLRRPHDVAARFGGEEFVCVLPETTLEGALAVARVLEEAVRALANPHVTSDVAQIVTVSLGVAVAFPARGDRMDALIASADRQLYRAKRSGRGQVCG